MTDNFINNVLNILRLIKASPELHGHSPVGYLNRWSGAELNQSAVHRVCAYLQDQCEGARALVDQSELAVEAKAGLLQTIDSLQTAFSIDKLGSSLIQQFPQLDAAISSFAILESVSNLGRPVGDPPELQALIDEIDGVAALFDDEALDPIVRETAKKHLHVLSALLREVRTFGVDAAMVAYFELLVRLRRVDAGASEPARSKVGKVWPTLERWGGRLALLDKALNSGQGLLGQAQTLGHNLLNYLP